MTRSSGIIQSAWIDGVTPIMSSAITMTAAATAKSNRLERTAAIGKSSLGKAIFVTSVELASRLFVPNLMAEMKNAQTTARIITEAMSSGVTSVFDHFAAAMRTSA